MSNPDTSIFNEWLEEHLICPEYVEQWVKLNEDIFEKNLGKDDEKMFLEWLNIGPALPASFSWRENEERWTKTEFYDALVEKFGAGFNSDSYKMWLSKNRFKETYKNQIKYILYKAIFKKYWNEFKRDIELNKWWLKADEGNDNATNIFERAQMTLSSMALTALKKSANLIQISYRPSASRSGQNHGDPVKIEQAMKRHEGKAEELVKKIQSIILPYKLPTNANAEKCEQIDNKIRGIDTKSAILLMWNNKKSKLADFSKFIENINILVDFGNKSSNIIKNSDLEIEHTKLVISYGNMIIECVTLNARADDMHTDYYMSQSWRDEPRILSLGAQLVLALGNEKGGCEHMSKLVYDRYLRVYGRGVFPECDDDNRTQTTFNSYHRYCERFRYPILNRLKSLKALADAAICLGSNVIDSENEDKYRTHSMLVGNLCNELFATANIYDSETHFSPHLSGATFALAYNYCVHENIWAIYDNYESNNNDEFPNATSQTEARVTNWANMPNLSSAIITREFLAETSIGLLRRSEQMFSMGKAYYENISHMQFLNDEFNDRNVHYNQARRMYSAEYISILAASIHDELIEQTLF